MAVAGKSNRIKLALIAGVTVFAIVLSVGSAYARLIDWASTEFIYIPSAQASYKSDCLVPEGQQILLADWQPEELERVITIGIERPLAAEPETTAPEGIRFGEHAASGGNRVDGAAARSQFVEAGGVRIEEGGHLVDERTRTAGTGFVHALFDTAGEEGDLRILTAELDGDIHVGDAPSDAFGRGDDFLHEGDTELVGQRDRAGTRRREGKVEPRKAFVLERFVEKLGNSRPYIGEVTLVSCVEHTTRPVEDNELHRGGADVETKMGQGRACRHTRHPEGIERDNNGQKKARSQDRKRPALKKAGLLSIYSRL